MQKTIEFVAEKLRTQGLSFLLLGIIAYYFYMKVENLSTEVKDCNRDMLRVYQEERVQFKAIVERNTIALEALQHRNNG